MIARIRKSLKKNDEGFTLIELLVVMIIIGILAAIAIPVFLNQRQKAQDTAARADVSTIGIGVNTYFVDHDGLPEITVVNDRYVIDGTLDLGPVSNNVELGAGSGAGNVGITGTDSTDWCVWVTNPEGDLANNPGFQYNSGGLSQGNCSGAST